MHHNSMRLFLAAVAIATALPTSANSTETQAPSKPTVVIQGFSGDTPDYIDHLRKTLVANISEGSCEDETARLKRQVLCISKSDNGTVTAKVGGRASSDDILNFSYGLITNQQRVPFEDPISFIARDKQGVYSLYVADYNGKNQKLIHKASEPILSPSWSPSGRHLTYVSFEGYRSAIYVHDITTGKRARVLSQRGLNAYPSFEDENTLLVSLSNERVNSDVYRLDLLTGKKERVTKTRRPEVYPKKTPDGIIFIQMHGDVPYLFSVGSNGKVTREHGLPQSTIDHSPVNNCRISSYGKTIDITVDGVFRSKKFKHGLESATIQSACEYSYVVTEDSAGGHIVTMNRYGEVTSKIRAKGQDIIQVSAH